MAVISKMTFDNGSTKNLIGSTFYGKCTTAAGTAAKTVTIGGWTESTIDNVSGTSVHIYFENGNTAVASGTTYVTLSIDGSNPHKIITDADVNVGAFPAGVYEFTFVPVTVSGYTEYRWLMGAKALSAITADSADSVPWSGVTGKPSLDFIPTSQKGANSGVATLDSNGKVPSSQLPSYVDDVLEYASRSLFPSTGISGIIYIAADTNLTYRWSGSNYVEISPSLALGTTHATAAYGDEGATAFAHATDSGRLTTAASAGLYKVSVTGEGHVGSATAVTKSDITALGIPGDSGVTSVTIKGTSPITIDSESAITTTGTRTISLANSYGDTKNPYAAKVANTVLAGPASGNDAAPTFRQLVAADIPLLTKSKISDFPTSMPASDVSAWAKASTKPSYSLSEIGGTIDLQEIEALTGTSGFLKKTAANTWTLDTNTYATSANITSAIEALDGSITGTPGASKTLTAFSETNGVVSATFGDISITKSQISDFPSSMTPTSHSHGKISNQGVISTTATISSGDRLIISDATGSNTNELVASSISFGSDSGKYLSNSGTWEDAIIPKVIEVVYDGTDYTVTTSASDLMNWLGSILYANMALSIRIIDSVSSDVIDYYQNVEVLPYPTLNLVLFIANKQIAFNIDDTGTGTQDNFLIIYSLANGGQIARCQKFTKTPLIDVPVGDNSGLYVLRYGYNSAGSTYEWQLMPTIPNVPTAPTVSGTYSLNITSNGASWTAVAPSGLQPPSSNGHYMLGVNGSSVTWESSPDLYAIEQLSGTSGILKKTAANTWTLDTTTYLASSAISDWAKASTKPSYSLSEIDGTQDLRKIEALADASTGFLKKTAANTWALDSTTYATSSDITSAINALDGSVTGTPGASKTLTAFSETDGVVSATFGDISITKSQISDFPTSMTPTEHSHGNINNYGQINTTVTISTNDKLAIIDYSAENAVKASSISFSSSGTGFLKENGTWGTPTNTTYTLSTGDANGQIKVTPSSGNAYNVDVKGLGSNAYTSTAYIPTSQKGANSGVAELDETGKVPSSQLPAYVDDVLEYATRSLFPSTGTSGIIYITADTNLTYRWSGSGYVEISPSLALGETSSTAYRGDRGATAYSHATDSSRLTTAQSSGLYKFATTAEGHIASVTAVQKSDITGLGIPAQDTTYTFDGTYNASTNKAATVKTVTDAIGALDGSVTGSAAVSKTLTAFSQTNGIVTAEFGDISITKSQVSDFPTSMPASDVSAWAKASTKPSYALSELTGASDIQAIEALTGTSGLLKKTAADTWSLDTTSYLPTTGGNVTGDITLLKQVASGAPGDSYALIFQRGTLTDSYNDWMIVDSQGYLYFKERGSGSTGWTTRVNFNTTGGVIATGQVQGNSIASSSFLTLGSTATLASGDSLVFVDSSDSNRIKRGGPTFGTDTTTFLRNDGTWATPSGGGDYIPTSEKGTASGVATLDTNSKVPIIQSNYLYGKCTTAGSTAAKTASIAGYDETTIANMKGVTVFIGFNSPNTAANPTLNISGSGAHAIVWGSLSDPMNVGNFSSGLHSFTLVEVSDTYYWFINEGRDTVPEAPSSNGTYILNVSSSGASWSSKTIPAAPTTGTVTINASGWSGNGPYSHSVTISGTTANSKIDLQPDSTVLAQMTTDGTTAIYIENNNGTLTAWAMGAKPTASLIIQYTKTEVA